MHPELRRSPRSGHARERIAQLCAALRLPKLTKLSKQPRKASPPATTTTKTATITPNPAPVTAVTAARTHAPLGQQDAGVWVLTTLNTTLAMLEQHVRALRQMAERVDVLERWHNEHNLH